MYHPTGVLVHAIDVRHPWHVEQTDGRDQHVGDDRSLAAALVHEHVPLLRRLVPASAAYLGAEVDVRAHLELVGTSLQVLLDLVALGEVARPREALPERVRVCVVRRVDTAPGVAVVPPGAAHLLSLLDDRVRHTRSAQRRTHGDPADPGSDHQHMQVAVGWRR